MIQVKLNNSNENPFYGLRNCLTLFQNTGGKITSTQLNACYNEVKNDKVDAKKFVVGNYQYKRLYQIV